MSGRKVTFLEAEAALGGAFLHPGGRAATERLLGHLALEVGDEALELGCGTGTTTELVAGLPGVSVVAIDGSAAMLRAAGKRVARTGLSGRVRFLRGDLNEALPLEDGRFEAVYAESVIALLEPEAVMREAARVLRGGGRLALNERIWRPGVSQEEVERVNALSRDLFGIPAATPTPLDREGWVALLERVGLVVDEVVAIAEMSRPADQASALRARFGRYRRYLARPDLAIRQAQFKRAMRRHRTDFAILESYLFLAHKPPSA